MMCEICVKAQDEAQPTGQGATADAWHRAEAMFEAWKASLPGDHEIHGLDLHDQLMAWADHIDSTTIERSIN